MIRFLLPALLAAATFAAGPEYELSGRIAPAETASISLYRVASPYTVSTLAGEDGRFTFKKLEPGAYTIAVFNPARGEARRTIEIGPAAADAHGRITLDLELKDSDFVVGDTLRRRNSVSARQLAIPEKAIREYEDAQKDLARHEVDTAIQRLEHAVELAPQFSGAWNNLGTIAYQTQKYERAAECFRRALEADPQSFEPLVNLGGVLINLHQLEEAWDYNVRAVLVRPNDALANSQLGMTYFGMGRLDLAEKHFLIARQADPAHFSHPQLFLAEIHLRRGDKLAAAADLDDFLKYHPDWPQAAKMHAAIEEWRGGGQPGPK
jgi:tetratricopeptide (TPR) repeat protein